MSDLIGKTFGRLTILKEVEPYHWRNKNIRRFLCKCSCGKEIITKLHLLKSGQSKSCGCLKSEIKKDLSGKVFGRLTVIERSSITKYSGKKKLVMWDCKCSCGNIISVNRTYLKNGKTQSCGCLKIEHDQKLIKYTPVEAAALEVWRLGYSDGDITFEEFLILCAQNCFYCGKPPSNKRSTWGQRKKKKKNNSDQNIYFIYNGLDRIDNKFNHNKNNVVPCCWDCNRRKGKFNQEQFFIWIETIYNHLKLKDK